MNDTTKKNRKISKSEIFWISFEGFAGFVGLFLLILGIVGDYLPVLYSENWIRQSEDGWMSFSHSQITYRWFGVFFLLGALVLALITLNHYAKKGDINEERELRRAQRMQVLNASTETVPVEVESSPKADAPKAEATKVPSPSGK